MTKVPLAELHRVFIFMEPLSTMRKKEEEEVEQEVESDEEKTLKERCACPWMG